MIEWHMQRMQLALGSFFVLALTGAIQHSWSLISTIKTVQITIDPNLSPECTALLQDELKKELADHKTQHTILDAMRSNFHCIDTIDAHLYAPGCMHYTITAHVPRYLINQQLIFCDNGTLIPHTWYNQTALECIPHLATTVSLEKGIAPDGLCRMIQRLSPTLISRYSIVWNNDIETILTHKEYPDFTITCNSLCTPDPRIFTHCEAIYHDLKQKNFNAKTVGINADIRFTNQIVIHTDRGRIVHG